jgi:Sulfotransferase domain
VWFFEPDSISIEALGQERFIEGRAYYNRLAFWWPHRHDPNVLLLAYEHMKRDHERSVRRVAEFIGVDVETETQRLAIACQEASLSSMKLHQDKYDDKMMRERSELVCEIPPGSATSKVRVGDVGAHKTELSAQFVGELDATWRETITAEFDIPDYAALLQVLEAGG